MSTPRLLLVDDNVRNLGGHFYELMVLLAEGAERLGYCPVVAVNRAFESESAFPGRWNLHRVFETRRMVQWSMGVDGKFSGCRGPDGRLAEGDLGTRMCSHVTDFLRPRRKRPTEMLKTWQKNFSDLLNRFQPTGQDKILINTADDFSLLALSAALQDWDGTKLDIDALLHFALVDRRDKATQFKLSAIGRQLRSTIDCCQPHALKLHTTNTPLTRQYQAALGGHTHVGSVHYPTRAAKVRQQNFDRPIKAILAGLPRNEKGSNSILELLKGLTPILGTSPDRLRLSLQLPTAGWETLIPSSLRPKVREAIEFGKTQTSLRGTPEDWFANSSLPIEVRQADLLTADYHEWLDSADVGIFLYDPDRYEARCSGVLLEMMARGIPSIVPDRCYLADEVRAGGSHRCIGYIYQNRQEIPALLQQFQTQRKQVVANCQEYAAKIATRHDPISTLRSLQIPVSRRIAA
jgi:glycosyltransferase involved in cell wall biosynthesis